MKCYVLSCLQYLSFSFAALCPNKMFVLSPAAFFCNANFFWLKTEYSFILAKPNISDSCETVFDQQILEEDYRAFLQSSVFLQSRRKYVVIWFVLTLVITVAYDWLFFSNHFVCSPTVGSLHSTLHTIRFDSIRTIIVQNIHTRRCQANRYKLVLVWIWICYESTVRGVAGTKNTSSYDILWNQTYGYL